MIVKLEKGLNSSLIALIPKKDNLKELKVFCPTSLINSL